MVLSTTCTEPKLHPVIIGMNKITSYMYVTGLIMYHLGQTSLELLCIFKQGTKLLWYRQVSTKEAARECQRGLILNISLWIFYYFFLSYLYFFIFIFSLFSYKSLLEAAVEMKLKVLGSHK